MKTNTKIKLLSSATTAIALLTSASAFAQTATTKPADATTSTDAKTADEDKSAIVVTGSLIRNPNLVQASPVNVTTEKEIQLKQSNTAEEVLRDVAGNVPSIGSSVNNGNGGASYVDLRGFGANRNVVLLDGNRIVPAGLGGAVDLNSIPLALVSRIDALTGAAVTTYGADAITGVVNFVTKKNFTGVDLSLGERITEKGDGNYFRGDLTVGANFADDRGNAVLSVGYQKSNAVYQGDRDYAYTAIDSFSGTPSGSGTPVPARFSFPGKGTRNSIDPSTGKIVRGIQPFNFNPFNLFQTPFKRYNLFAQANYQVTDAIDVYTRGLFSKTQVISILAPGGIFSLNVNIPYSNPFLPAAARQQFCSGSLSGTFSATSPLTPAQCDAAALANSPSDPNYKTFNSTVRRRTVENGTRDYNFTTTLFDYEAGVRGKLTDSINFDLHGAYGESQNDQLTTGYIRASRIKDALLATGTGCISGNSGCVPFNLFGAAGSITPAQLAYVRGDQAITIKTSLTQVHGQVSGDFGLISPGASNPVSFALGAEYRGYTASQQADPLSLIPGELSGTSGSTPVYKGKYHVYEGFSELVVPLIEDKPFFRNLTLEGGARYSSYTVDGATKQNNTWTYKGGLTWEPVEGFKFRGSYAHAVRAPNIAELFLPVTTQLTNLSLDPCAGAAPLTNSTLAATCIAQGAPAASIGQIANPSAGQANYYGGGNINLQPEKANTYTVGVVLTPHQLSGFNASLDYYHIKVTNVIGSPLPGDAIAACFTNPSPTSPACLAIRRDPGTGALDGDASTTPGLPLTLSNLGRLETRGFDLAVNYDHRFGGVKWSMTFIGNHTINSKYQATPSSVNRECVGFYSTNCSFTGSLQPKWQFSLRNTIGIGGVDVSLLWRHLSGFKQEPQSVIDGDASPAFVGNLAPGLGALSGTAVDFSRIKPYNVFDMTMRFNVEDNYTFTFGVMNLLNKKPPLVGYDIGSTSFNSGNTYPSTFDTLGRRYAVSVNIKY